MKDLVASPRWTIVLSCVALWIVMSCGTLAQEDSIKVLPPYRLYPELYVMLQDSSLVYLVVDDTDTVDGRYVAPYFSFDIPYDSTCTTSYMLGEWRRNGNLLYLPTWEDGRHAYAHSDLLSFNSTTDTFICQTGDTLSFYRELTWWNPITYRQDTNNYYSLDTLSFSVELIRDSDSTRVALLDSIGILPSLQPGRPRIHAARPLMALVSYEVPASLEGVRAFMRIRARHKGAGEYYFTRSDNFAMGLSPRLQDSSWLEYIEMFSIGRFAYKVGELEELQRAERPAGTAFMVRFVSGSSSEIIITFPSAPAGGTAVAIYDALGRLLFYPSMTPASEGEQTVGYRFEQSGTYFIGLLHDNRLVGTHVIHVTL